MKQIIETDNEYICELEAPCFQSLSPQEVALVKSSRTQVAFRKGDNLTKQGAFASYILLVIKGLAKQYIEDNGNKSFNLRIIQPGEFVGLSTVFSSKTFNYSSVALTDCQAFLVEKSSIATIMNQNGVFGAGLISRYLEQNVNLFDTLRTVMYKQMNGRMAQTLLYLNNLKQGHPDIFQLLTRKDLADFAGISTESAVKLLKAFEKDGSISLKEKNILIINEQTLKDLSIRG